MVLLVPSVYLPLGGEEVSRLPGLEAGGLAHASPFPGSCGSEGTRVLMGSSSCGPAHAAACWGMSPPSAVQRRRSTFTRAHRAAGEATRVSERLKFDSGRKPSFALVPVLLNLFRVTLSLRSPQIASAVRGHLPAQGCPGL